MTDLKSVDIIVMPTLNKRTPNCLYLSSSLAKNLAATAATSTPMMEAALGGM